MNYSQNQNDSISLLLGGDFSPFAKTSSVANNSIWDTSLEAAVNSADAVIINLEGPLTDNNNKRPKIGINLKSSPKTAELLRKSGVSFVSLANNHIFDYEWQGVLDTIDALKMVGIDFAGIGSTPDEATTIKIINVKGKTVAFLFLAEHEFNYQDDFSPSTGLLNPAKNVLQIIDAKKNCDYVIVFSHSGPEHTCYPSPRMVSLFRCFVKAGASAVINCHSHCPMGMEVYQGSPIFYGLGNLYFSLPSKEQFWYKGLLAHLRLMPGHIDAKIIFTTFSNDGEIKIKRDLDPNRQEHQNNISAILADPERLDAHWHAFCCKQRKHLFHEIFRGILAMLPFSLKRCLFKNNRLPPSHSYYAKGARMLRGLLRCENHVDVLA